MVTALKILALTVMYFVLAKLGLHFAQDNPSASIIWPASGVAAAATYIWGYKTLIGVFAGAFVANYTNDTTLLASGLIGAGNAAEAGAIAFLLRKLTDFRSSFDYDEDILKLGPVAAAGAVISATVGAIAISTHEFWVTWWAGDTFGVLLLVPPILLWRNRASKTDTVIAFVVSLIAFVLIAYAWLGF